MLEIRLERFGPPSIVAQCQKVPDLEKPSAWEVIVQVEAFPINPADLAMLSGRYGILPRLPSSIGMEGAGTIVECGKSVTDLKVGDRVMIVGNNNWSQFRKVPAKLVHRVSATLDPLVAATMKVNPATAYMLLTQYQKLKKGSWVIQNAPLSNVGRLVIQFANLLGYRTVNLVRRASAIEEVLAIGGQVAVLNNSKTMENVREQIGLAKVPLGLDAVGGNSAEQLAKCCSNEAKIVSYGMLSGEPSQVSNEHVIFRGLQHVGYWLSHKLNRFSHQERQETV